MVEMSAIGVWNLENIEDRERLFNEHISPEKACFIGAVCAYDALREVYAGEKVSLAATHVALESLSALDAEHDFSAILEEDDSSAVSRLILARYFWRERVSGKTDGHMFVSAEPEGHDLVGELGERPTLWKIVETADDIVEGDLLIRAGNLLVAQTTLLETEDTVTINENRLLI